MFFKSSAQKKNHWRKILLSTSLVLSIFLVSCSETSANNVPADEYDEGYNEGYDDGYNVGYSNGYDDAIWENTPLALAVDELLSAGLYAAVQDLHTIYPNSILFGPYVADWSQMLVHDASCTMVDDMVFYHPQDITGYLSLEGALDQGLSPCQSCSPSGS